MKGAAPPLHDWVATNPAALTVRQLPAPEPKAEIVRLVVDARPESLTENSVVEALLVTSNTRAPVPLPAAQTESFEYGVVVPSPTLPDGSMRIFSERVVPPVAVVSNLKYEPRALPDHTSEDQPVTAAVFALFDPPSYTPKKSAPMRWSAAVACAFVVSLSAPPEVKPSAAVERLIMPEPPNVVCIVSGSAGLVVPMPTKSPIVVRRTTGPSSVHPPAAAAVKEL